MSMGTRFSNACAGLLIAVAVIGRAGPALGAQQQSSSAPNQSTPPSASTATQTAPNPAEADKLPISLDRIREQLAREPAFTLNMLHALDEIPVFRTETRSDLVFRPDPNYWKDNDVGSYVRPSVNQWHYDFMKMTNPNLPAGYGPGTGIDVLPALQSAFSGIRHAFSEHERAQVRRQIQEELRIINEQRRAAGLPPIDQNGQPTQPDDRP
jgi:hypothetical protein